MLVMSLAGRAQVQPATNFQLTESTVVKDSAGVILSYATWREMMTSGKYILRSNAKAGAASDFVMVKLSDSQIKLNRERFKPMESE